MKYFRLTQQSLGQRLGVTKGYLSVMMNDKEPISTKVLDGLIKSFAGLNSHWLLTGDGQMFLEKKEVAQVPEAGVLTGVMEPEAVYERVRGEGRLEYLERVVGELLERVRVLEEEARGEEE